MVAYTRVDPVSPFNRRRLSRGLIDYFRHDDLVPEVRVRSGPLAAKGDRAHDRLCALFTGLLLAVPFLRTHGRQRHSAIRIKSRQ